MVGRSAILPNIRSNAIDTVLLQNYQSQIEIGIPSLTLEFCPGYSGPLLYQAKTVIVPHGHSLRRTRQWKLKVSSDYVKHEQG
jgi:hypothetical protein